ncbi:MAG TPA: MFS transporter, partial [Gemmataceae bacterium]|nr:MFS transporter [Gemmataceae bacterium]
VDLFAARFFIGIGEAGCLVIGPTLIADYFTKQVRGRALSIFFLGVPLGGTAGYIVAGLVTKYWGPWRHAFYFAGLPGLVLAVFIALLIDPPRGGDDATAADGRIHGIKPYLDLLRNRTLLLIILAQAFAVIILVPLLHFGVGFFEDKHKMSKEDATVTLGVIALIAGALGNSLSGVIGDRLARRRKGAYAFLAGIAYLVGLPCLLFGLTTPSKQLMLPALTLGAFCLFLSMPAVNTQIANCVSAKQRAMAYALAVFILHLLGDTAAPPVFGKVAEALSEKPAASASAAAHESGKAEETAPSHRAGDPIGTQRAFAYFSFSLLLASACCFLAARTAWRDEELAAADSSGEPAPTPGLH